VTLAITVHDGHLATVADYAECILILADGADLEQAVPQELVGRDLVASLRAGKVSVLVCGAISCLLAERLAAAGIQVADGWTGPVDAVLAAYHQGGAWDPGLRLPCHGPDRAFGPCRRRRRRRGRHDGINPSA
jgi:hypothetical protein